MIKSSLFLRFLLFSCIFVFVSPFLLVSLFIGGLICFLPFLAGWKLYFFALVYLGGILVLIIYISSLVRKFSSSIILFCVGVGFYYLESCYKLKDLLFLREGFSRFSFFYLVLPLLLFRFFFLFLFFLKFCVFSGKSLRVL